MTPETFIEEAEKLGFKLFKRTNDAFIVSIDGVGVAFFNSAYSPQGCALCKYWSDDILLDRIRLKVLLDGTPEIAYDYLELLSTLERKDSGPNPNRE